MRELDGRMLYYAFRAGAGKVFEHQDELNRINVFPVKDGDTGTNLVATVHSVLDRIRPHRSFKTTADDIADAAIIGARGNSGIIFAQFFYGLSAETGSDERITIADFAGSIKRSIRYVTEAISHPVEGTMITVIRDWAEYIHENHAGVTDFRQLILASGTVLKKSLLETKTKLEVLAKANVVDSGAKGFVLFIDGILDLIRTKKLLRFLHPPMPINEISETHEILPDTIAHRYCTEAILRNAAVDLPALQSILEPFGDSVIVAGSKKVCHLHVHTNDPAELMSQLRPLADIPQQKVEDMYRQSETVQRRKWNIALVTDSTCDLPEEQMDRYQIHSLPLSLHFGVNQYLDKLTIKPEQFYALLSSSAVFPSTSQINEAQFRRLYSYLATYYDAVIAIHLTGMFSGTHQSSRRAAEKTSRETDTPIAVIDSKNLSGALGLLVLRTAQAIETGLEFEDIVSSLKSWIPLSKIFVSVPSLDAMVRGGRVSYMKGRIASLLNINPIVSMNEEGNSYLFGNAFTQRSNMRKVMQHIERMTRKNPVWNYMTLHADNPEAAAWYTERMTAITGKGPVGEMNISPVIGMHAGNGAASVACMFLEEA